MRPPSTPHGYPGALPPQPAAYPPHKPADEECPPCQPTEPAQCVDGQCGPEEECLVMDCNTNCEGLPGPEGGSARGIASQSAVVRAMGTLTVAFGIVELGLGAFACVMVS